MHESSLRRAGLFAASCITNLSRYTDPIKGQGICQGTPANKLGQAGKGEVIIYQGFTIEIIATNGPAIWGGYGALFAIMVQILLSITRVAVQV